ncbi:ABC transporter permease [Entomomonas moraniae]|uniref:Transport permease protein n=1 Tax=Entomomonas moraniae TaxID=2213226 RepID=A0A3Q9JK70_9GAMM|nr:ABC transporter permease [Entomomonas moraniae]AZS50112.1 ABC transporter permease [Entomomonas moraniae]
MFFISGVTNLAHKEFIAIIKDRITRAILIIPIVIQTLLFGYAATYDLNSIPYAVMDESHSQNAANLIARIEGNHLFQRIASLTNTNQIKPLIDNQKVLLVVHIDQRFEKQIQSGKEAPIQIILDARNSNTAGIAASYISQIITSYNQTLTNRPPINIEVRAWYNPNLESRWHIMPAMIATLSFLQTIIFTALSISKEREQGTFDQLLVTPLTPIQLMLGKAIPPILIGLLQAGIVNLMVVYWFRIPMIGSYWLLYSGLLLSTIACVGIGLSISALSNNMQQSALYTFIFVMPAILLSGLATPIANMPNLLQQLTLLNPLRYSIDFVRRVYLENTSLSEISYDLYPQIVIAFITLPIATVLFRKKLN